MTNLAFPLTLVESAVRADGLGAEDEIAACADARASRLEEVVVAAVDTAQPTMTTNMTDHVRGTDALVLNVMLAPALAAP
jgi:hypothetical protein